jgi:hypothetical protein
MRELSDESARHQAEQFTAYASRLRPVLISGIGRDVFDRWAATKGFSRDDREAIERAVRELEQ